MKKYRALATTLCLILVATIPAVYVDQKANYAKYSEKDLQGRWTSSGWLRPTLLTPLPMDVMRSIPANVPSSSSDQVTLEVTTIGLFSFDGDGTIENFQQQIEFGHPESVPPSLFHLIPLSTNQGCGQYSVESNGLVGLSMVQPCNGAEDVAREIDYACVLNRSPKQLNCIPSRFEIFVLDPVAFHGGIVGEVVLRPQQ